MPLTQRGTSANKHLNDEPLRQLRNTSDYDEIDLLDKRIIDECPERGYAPPLNSKVKFATLPISQSTLLGLSRGDEEVLGKNGKKRKSEVAKRGVTGRSRGKNAKDMGDDIKKFIVMTDIQHAVIPHALKGRDILGAAKTGR